MKTIRLEMFFYAWSHDGHPAFRDPAASGWHDREKDSMLQPAPAFLHAADFRNLPLRFFAPPSGRPDLPWVAISDLPALSRLTRHQQQVTLTMFRNGDFQALFRTVTHDDDILKVCPVLYAREICYAFQDEGLIDADLNDFFIRTNKTAFRKQQESMPDRDPAWFFQAMGAHADFSWPQT
ncbi:hypothetical protein CFR75_14715 [Komagataeibacter xylinus]|uniref:Uncharacterized protein n=2 Tax=Komagataeibacter TaxID=1434011 RepID=A0A850PCZ1_9PROT|nr:MULTISPECIES: hypothetical protein [Komagataeibacter]NVN38881.1 hypothetical protein [Komagataeibacter swingsii]PYD55764.1 hypothetical protein CFR75_14715 [Komagataeibacter xylinus]